MTQIFAHRGSKGTHPENTLASFAEAVACGADGIELDVHLSKDNELIVIHDETVDRTTNGHGIVQNLTLAELKKLDAGSWFDSFFSLEKIPTFQEVTNLLNQVNYTGVLNIEIKTDIIAYKNIEKMIYEWMSSQKWSFHYIYSSFSYQSLVEINQLAPEIPKAFIMYAEEALIAKALEAPFIDALHPRYLSLKKKQKAMHGFPKKLRPWTVNKEAHMIDCFNQRIAAFHTDYPEKALKVREKWQVQHGK